MVPFFSGAFDDPNYDDVNDPTSQAGITCTACHAITNVNSQKGNADYTIEAPSHYPFTFSDNKVLQWVNRQLVKAKPAFHKKTFLKPLHKTPEFCGSCHKVHLPEELNDYKWLRGQNHYDSYHLSGVSGHGVSSFYYPPEAEQNCNECHMPLQASEDFGALYRDDSGERTVHDHLFPSANAAIPFLKGSPDWVTQAHQDFNEGVMRVDLFGIKREGTIEGELVAPLRPSVPSLHPGERVLLEVVIRTVKMGHHFTQGTTDSNQVWLDVKAEVEDGSGGARVVGRSGGMDPIGTVDPWSYFVNNYVLDKDGNRIDRRNAQDIFVALYNHQIPPGAGEVVHYALQVPEDASGELVVEVDLRYRKFDTTLMRYVEAEDFDGNDLPILELARDRIVFPIAPADAPVTAEAPAPEFPEWQRWNDYGIGLLRKSAGAGTAGQLREAEEAFREVERLGRPDGPLNLARVYVREGRLDEAVEALQRARGPRPAGPGLDGRVVHRTGRQAERLPGRGDRVVREHRRARHGGDPSPRVRLLAGLPRPERAGPDAVRAREAGAWRGPSGESRRVPGALALLVRACVGARPREPVGALQPLAPVRPPGGRGACSAPPCRARALQAGRQRARPRRRGGPDPGPCRRPRRRGGRDLRPRSARRDRAAGTRHRPAGSEPPGLGPIHRNQRRAAAQPTAPCPKRLTLSSRRSSSRRTTPSSAPPSAGRWRCCGRRGRGPLGLVVPEPRGRGGEETVIETGGPEVAVDEIQAPDLPFTDVTGAAGIDFVHVNGAYGDRLLPETMGGGAGLPGLRRRRRPGPPVRQQRPLARAVRQRRAPRDQQALPERRQRGVHGRDGGGGLALSFYGMGVAVGDYDCDGDPDLYLTAVGPNRLFANEGGRFTEVDAGVSGADDSWSTCATFLDADGDGDLTCSSGTTCAGAARSTSRWTSS